MFYNQNGNIMPSIQSNDSIRDLPESSCTNANHQAPLFSIILPCFNVANYLGKCLDSIFSNDTSDTEIIIVNDGSTDDFNNFIASYFSLHEESLHLDKDILILYYGQANVKILTQKNRGVSCARNTGIKHATGEYFLFVDPDDYVSEKLLHSLRDKLSERRYDMIMYGFRRENTYLNQQSKEFMPRLRHEVYNNSEAIRDLLPNYLGFSINNVKNWITTGSFSTTKEPNFVWRIAYRSELLRNNNITFNPQIKSGEDAIFNMYCVAYSRTIGIINDALYYYICRKPADSHFPHGLGYAQNKTLLLEERLHIMQIPNVQKNSLGLKDFAGSNVLSIIDMMFNSPISDFSVIKAYSNHPAVRKSIAMMPVILRPNCRSFVFNMITILLKVRCHRLLFGVIYIFKKLGIRYRPISKPSPAS